MEKISDKTLTHFNISRNELKEMNKIFNKYNNILQYSKRNDLHIKDKIIKYTCTACNKEYSAKNRKKHENTKKHLDNINNHN